jgi:hypothetical protein
MIIIVPSNRMFSNLWVRVSHISRKTREIWGTLWSFAGRDPKREPTVQGYLSG